MKIDKVRLCIALPKELYEKLENDSMEYGMPKTGIIAMLLMNYYKGNAENIAKEE